MSITTSAFGTKEIVQQVMYLTYKGSQFYPRHSYGSRASPEMIPKHKEKKTEVRLESLLDT